MTDPRIAKAKARLAEATPGQFVVLETADGAEIVVLSLDVAKETNGKRCIIGRIRSPEGVTNEDRANADTIAQALNSHAAALELAEAVLSSETPPEWVNPLVTEYVDRFLDTLGEQE